MVEEDENRLRGREEGGWLGRKATPHNIARHTRKKQTKKGRGRVAQAVNATYRGIGRRARGGRVGK